MTGTSPRITTLPLALALIAGCVVGEDGELPSPAADDEALEEHVADNYIAVLRSDLVAGVVGQIDWSAEIGGIVEIQRYNALKVFTFRGTPEAALEIAARAEVDYVEPDRIVSLSLPGFCKWVPEHPQCQDDGGGEEPPTDPDRPSWCQYLPDHPLCADDPGAPGGDDQVIPWGVERVGGSLGDSGRTAWVIDTGVDLDHADLQVDTGRSKNFVSTETIVDDTNGHGTHVAGTIAAIDNGIDVVGVAAGNLVVGVRVLDTNGSGAISDIVAGIDYVAQNASPGDVANMSLGGKGESQAMEDAIRRAADLGIRFAVAAGNDAADASGYTPAAIEYPGVTTVSAIGRDDCLASFSNYGAPVDIAAPGVEIVSLANGGGTRPLDGTSMATPHVAGLLLHDSLRTDGTICGDKDGTPDSIAHR